MGWIVIALVAAAGCWIRWKIAAGELLWLDELHTGWAVGGSFDQTLTRSAQGNQTPLFFGLAWAVVQCLGASEFSLRLVSLVSGSLAMAMAAMLVWRQTKSIGAATVTLSLIAIDDNFIWYATEARPYSMLHLASVLQAGGFWCSLQRWKALSVDDQPTGAGRWIGPLGLLLSSWLVVYTHYTGVFLLAAEVLFLIPMFAGRWLSGNALKQISVTTALFAVGCLPLLFQMNQAFGKPTDWSSVANLKDFRAEQMVNGIRWFAIPLVAVALSTVISFLRKRQPAESTVPINHWRNAGWLSWIVAWFLIPLLIIVGLHVWAGIPIALSRYLSVGIIAGPIFAGALVGASTPQSRWIAIPIIFMASVYAHLHDQNFPSTTQPRLTFSYRVLGTIARDGQLPLLRGENWRAPIGVVNDSTERAKWPVFLFGAVLEDANALTDADPEFQAYLQFPVQSLYAIDADERTVFAGPTMSHQHFDGRHLSEVVGQGGAWVLVRHLPGLTQEIASELENQIRTELGDHNAAIKTNWFGNRDNVVHLISIEIKPY